LVERSLAVKGGGNEETNGDGGFINGDGASPLRFFGNKSAPKFFG